MWNSLLSAISRISGSFSMILSLFQPSKGKKNIYIYMKIDAQNVVALVVDMHSDFKNKYVYVRRWLVSSSVYHLNQNKGKIKKF